MPIIQCRLQRYWQQVRRCEGRESARTAGCSRADRASAGQPARPTGTCSRLHWSLYSSASAKHRSTTTTNLTIMRVELVCLSASSSAFPVAWSRTPTAAFVSLGLRYMPPPWPPPAPTGSLRGWGLSWVFFPSWFCQVRQYSAQLRTWRHLVNDGHLTVQFSDFAPTSPVAPSPMHSPLD